MNEVTAELLQALKVMVSNYPYWMSGSANGEKQIDRDAVGLARAVIAKAEAL